MASTDDIIETLREHIGGEGDLALVEVSDLRDAVNELARLKAQAVTLQRVHSTFAAEATTDVTARRVVNLIEGRVDSSSVAGEVDTPDVAAAPQTAKRDVMTNIGPASIGGAK
ncbi:hypothetical protein [Microbacterium sp. 13-71-7]|uniref:hypothetical protein n=1 Tax=Microbacterium sp. 13-71-7 TaxID=1970399 RepID=UPI000BD73D7F|nr:hypothetical protein [Microbacterium sp. 13-71-7]OZB80950.1 MAG: hypothetical protein B7X32_18160 [Microbacterium sp. 13-71-7]